MVGRKPKPTVLHDLHGDPSHLRRKMAARRVVEPPVADASGFAAPPDMTESQRAIWDDAIASAPPGILKRIDTSVLRAWVVAYDLHRQASAQQALTTILVPASRDPEKAETSALVQSPLLAVINRQGVMLMRAAEQLGFSPTSRPRLAQAGVNPPIAPSAPAPAARRRGRAERMSLLEYIASAPRISRMN